MSHDITAEVNVTRLNDRIFELQDAFIGAGQTGDAMTVFEDESRLFLQQVIRLTPPKTKKQGEDAVDRDMMKIFTPVSDDMLNTIGSEHGLSAIDVWITTATGDRRELKWMKIDPIGHGMAAFHNANRDRRGRARNLKRQKGLAWYAPYVVSFEDFAAYRDKIRSHVGRRKAAWGKSFIALGGKITNWISRHLAGAKGEFHQVVDPLRPSITMINYSPGIMNDEHVIRSALRVRYEAIGRHMRLIVSGYSKDVAQGLKVTRKAHKTPIPEAA